MAVVVNIRPLKNPAGEVTGAESTGHANCIVTIASALEMRLQSSGHDVRMAYDGPTALQAALDHGPDVVLLDIGLPGFSGYEVAKRMRQQAGLSNVMLIAMRVWPRGRPTTLARHWDRSSPGQAGRLQQSAENPDRRRAVSHVVALEAISLCVLADTLA